MPEELQLQLLPQGNKSLSERTQLKIRLHATSCCLMPYAVALLSQIRNPTLATHLAIIMKHQTKQVALQL